LFKFKITLEYDGTNFYGWQIQPDHRTVQGELEKALFKMTSQRTKVRGAARTDRGVHALAQVASFQISKIFSERELLRGLNALTPDDIAITSVEKTKKDFDPRFQAKSKIYRYIIWNQPVSSPLRLNYSWHIPQTLDIEKMKLASKYLIGTHDFSGFRASECKRINPTRTIYNIKITKEHKPEIHIEIEADGFLKHMVRIIVGTLVKVGLHKIEPAQIKAILESKDRRKAGITAPGQGLFLVKVIY
jgi:tRNA pseudouridine38-40 synthase